MNPVLIGVYTALGLGLAMLAFLVFEPCRKGTVRQARAVVKARRAFCRPSRWAYWPMMGGPLPQQHPDTWLVTLSIEGSSVEKTIGPDLYEQMFPGTKVGVVYGRGVITNQIRIIELEAEE